MFLSTKTTSRLALAVSLVLIVAVLPARGQPALQPPVVPEEVSPFEVIHPETSDKRTADAVVRKPPGKGPFPAVIYLHGGLMKQSVETLKKWFETQPNMSRFLAAGYVTVLATFHERLQDPQEPKTLLDIRAVFDHVSKMPEVDARSVVIWGFSGGGSHALQLAGELNASAIAVEEPAVGLLSGIYTVESFGGKPPFGPENYNPILADPEKYITDTAQKRTHDVISKITCPVFYAHGDTIRVNKINDLLLVPELKLLKDQVVIKGYKDAPHGFSRGHEGFFADCDAFFKKHLKTQPTPITLDGEKKIPDKR